MEAEKMGLREGQKGEGREKSWEKRDWELAMGSLPPGVPGGGGLVM